MNNRILRTIVAALIALPLCLAYAQDDGGADKGKGKGRPPQGGKGGPGGGPPGGPPKFSDIDTDDSGDVSLAEWTAFQVKTAEDRAARSFDFISGDDDKITEEELKAMMARRGGPGGGKGGPPGGDKGKGKGGKGGKGGPDGGGQKPKRPAPDES